MWSPDEDDSPGVLEYQDRKYAVGLLWLITGEDEKKTLRRRRIKKAQADFYCLRSHVSKQIGFGWLGKGHRRNMPVAATIVADQLVGEWHGVFQADNGWWYMQVHSDAIAPNGDRFFTAESDAYAVFQENLTKHNWSHSYAPVHWNIVESSREMTLARLLDDLPSVTLQPTNFDAALGGAQNRNLLVVALFTAFLLVIAAYVFSNLWSGPDQVISAPKSTPIPTLEPPKRDIVELPSPLQVIAQCQEASEALFKPLPGWTLETLTCSETQASVMWDYDERHGSLAQDGLRAAPTDGTVTLQGNMVIVKKNLQRPPLLVQDNLLTPPAAVLELQRVLGQLGTLAIKPVTPPPASPPPQRMLAKDAPKPAPVQPRPYLDVDFKTQEAPQDMARYINLNGLQLISMVWDIQKGIWTYKIKVMLDRPSVGASPSAVKAGGAS